MINRLSPQLESRATQDALREGKAPGQIGRQYGAQPNSVGLRSEDPPERGNEVFVQDGTIQAYKGRLAQLERLLDNENSRSPQVLLRGRALGGTDEYRADGDARVEAEPTLRAFRRSGRPSASLHVALPSVADGELHGPISTPAGAPGAYCSQARSVWPSPGSDEAAGILWSAR